MTASGGTDYAWSSGESVAAITMSPVTTTTYTERVTQYVVFATRSQSPITVAPRPMPMITVAETSGLSNNDGTICDGASVTLTSSSATSYVWSTTPTQSTQTTTALSPMATTTYSVTVTDANNCQSATSTTITVTALPVPAIAVTETSGLMNDDGSLCANESVTMTASGGGSYSWSSGLGVNSSVTLAPTTSIYTDRTAWLSAVSGTPTLDNYTGASPGFAGTPVSRAGYSLSATGGIWFNSVAATAPEVSTVNSNVPIVITFSSPQTAVALNAWVSNIVENYIPGTIIVSAGSVTQQKLVSAPTFFGIISSVPFTTVTISNVTGSGLFPTLDDLDFASHASTPFLHNYDVVVTYAQCCIASTSTTMTV
ncbi:MAG: hypothetical protein ACK5XN_37875, partial [Bacteroidota bacterium]